MHPSQLRARTIALIALAAPFSADTLFVDAQLASGANDGSTWTDAFQGPDGLQAALAAAVAGDEVFVADGVYRPTSTGSRTVAFAMPPGVEIYGSFLGGETTPEERPPFGTAPSILSGDLAGNDAGGIFSDNSVHVVTTAGTTATAVLDGFEVTAGNANVAGGNNDRGGGIICTASASPTVRNCRFSLNRSSFGGAAGYINTGGAPSFTDCSFEMGLGGSFGGAFDIAGGGAVRFERCLFANNRAQRAGALEVFATNGVVVNNCIFRDNTSTGAGGGGGLWIGQGGNTVVRNTTIVRNASNFQGEGGLRVQNTPNTTISGCIFWSNSGPSGSQTSADQVNAVANVTYSLVQGGHPGQGNISADPQFVDLAGNNFATLVSSPCIDAGNNFAVPVGSVLDFAGNERLVDELTVADTGLGAAPIVDLGAFEFSQPFTALAGCAGNPATLQATTPTFALGEPLTFQLTNTVQPGGAAFYYAGSSAVDGMGCGIVLPVLLVGELLLGLSPAPTLIGDSPVVASSSTFTFTVPNQAALAGSTFAFQAIDILLSAHLSTAIVGTIAP